MYSVDPKIINRGASPYQYKMLKKSIGLVEFGANVYVNSSSGYILFVNPMDGKMVYLDILESSILGSFYDYFEHMDKALFYSEEEMRTVVEEVLSEYE